jgi:hypothetical protein
VHLVVVVAKVQPEAKAFLVRAKTLEQVMQASHFKVVAVAASVKLVEPMVKAKAAMVLTYQHS